MTVKGTVRSDPEEAERDANWTPCPTGTINFSLITEAKTRRIEPDITVVEISERLNLGNILASNETSIKSLIEKGARKLVIDVTGLNYIDSSGIGMLVSSNGFMEQSGGRMRIAGARGAVAKAFEVVHMSRIVPLDADLESACRNLAAGSAAV
jgi:anti-sigma B factor antagonist